MKIDLSETKPVYEIHIWYKTNPSLWKFDECVKYDNKDEALEAYHNVVDCEYKILMEYAGNDGDALLEYSRGDVE